MLSKSEYAAYLVGYATGRISDEHPAASALGVIHAKEYDEPSTLQDAGRELAELHGNEPDASEADVLLEKCAALREQIGEMQKTIDAARLAIGAKPEDDLAAAIHVEKARVRATISGALARLDAKPAEMLWNACERVRKELDAALDGKHQAQALIGRVWDALSPDPDVARGDLVKTAAAARGEIDRLERKSDAAHSRMRDCEITIEKIREIACAAFEETTEEAVTRLADVARGDFARDLSARSPADGPTESEDPDLERVNSFAKSVISAAKERGVISNDQMHEIAGIIDRRLWPESYGKDRGPFCTPAEQPDVLSPEDAATLRGAGWIEGDRFWEKPSGPRYMLNPTNLESLRLIAADLRSEARRADVATVHAMGDALAGDVVRAEVARVLGALAQRFHVRAADERAQARGWADLSRHVGAAEAWEAAAAELRKVAEEPAERGDEGPGRSAGPAPAGPDSVASAGAEGQAPTWDREALGREVHGVYMAWTRSALSQTWEMLGEKAREHDRMVGERLFSLGLAEGQLRAAAEIEAWRKATGCGDPKAAADDRQPAFNAGLSEGERRAKATAAELAARLAKNERRAASAHDACQGSADAGFHDGRRVAYAYSVRWLCAMFGISPPTGGEPESDYESETVRRDIERCERPTINDRRAALGYPPIAGGDMTPEEHVATADVKPPHNADSGALGEARASAHSLARVLGAASLGTVLEHVDVPDSKQDALEAALRNVALANIEAAGLGDRGGARELSALRREHQTDRADEPADRKVKWAARRDRLSAELQRTDLSAFAVGYLNGCRDTWGSAEIDLRREERHLNGDPAPGAEAPRFVAGPVGIIGDPTPRGTYVVGAVDYGAAPERAGEPTMRIERRADGAEWLVGATDSDVNDCMEEAPTTDRGICHYHLNGEHIRTDMSVNGAELIIARWPIASSRDEPESHAPTPSCAPVLLVAQERAQDNGVACATHGGRLSEPKGPAKPLRVEVGQRWRCRGVDTDLEVASMGDAPEHQHVRLDGRGGLPRVWANARAMLSLDAWTFLGGPAPDADERWQPGAVWEHRGYVVRRLELRQVDEVRGLAFLHVQGTWSAMQSIPCAKMTEANGWRYVGRPREPGDFLDGMREGER